MSKPLPLAEVGQLLAQAEEALGLAEGCGSPVVAVPAETLIQLCLAAHPALGERGRSPYLVDILATAEGVI